MGLRECHLLSPPLKKAFEDIVAKSCMFFFFNRTMCPVCQNGFGTEGGMALGFRIHAIAFTT
jgi:hypothetical protein